MAKRRGKSKGYRRKFTLPVAVVGGFIPLLAKAASDIQQGGIQGLQNTIPAIVPYSPANRRFTTAYLSQGLIPIVIGFIVHKIASMTGINRALSQARVPFLRI